MYNIVIFLTRQSFRMEFCMKQNLSILICLIWTISLYGVFDRDIQQLLHELNESQPFAFATPSLTYSEIMHFEKFNLDSIKPNQMKYLDQFGSNDENELQLSEYLNNLGKNQAEAIQTLVDTIRKIIKDVLEASEKDSAWVRLTAYGVTSEFDITRWHIDGPTIIQHNLKDRSPHFKCMIALKGSSTKFCHLSVNERESFITNYDNRKSLDHFFQSHQTCSPNTREMAFFLIGDLTRSAIQTEPKMDTPSLYLSILPGSREEIYQLYLSWHQLRHQIDENQSY